MLQASHTNESFAHALARRALTQEMPPGVLTLGDARREVAVFAPDLAPLGSSFGMTQDEVTQALRGQQMQLADDIRSLFPSDGFMDHVSAQTEAKAQADAPPQRLPRER